MPPHPPSFTTHPIFLLLYNTSITNTLILTLAVLSWLKYWTLLWLYLTKYSSMHPTKPTSTTQQHPTFPTFQISSIFSPSPHHLSYQRAPCIWLCPCCNLIPLHALFFSFQFSISHTPSQLPTPRHHRGYSTIFNFPNPTWFSDESFPAQRKQKSEMEYKIIS